MKRYAIIRLCTDKGVYRCPTNNGKCLYPKGVEVYCKKCAEINGDTKEQLVMKVAQVIKKRTDNGIIVRYREDSISAEELAKEIVEFLGVE